MQAPVEHVAVMDRDGLPGSALVVAPVPWDAEFSEALCKMRKSITAVFLGDLVGQFVLPRSHFVLMTDCVVAQVRALPWLCRMG